MKRRRFKPSWRAAADIARTNSVAAIVLGLVLIVPLQIGSETVTLSTTYPSPVGIYHRIITTGTNGPGPGDTYLNRDNGDLYLASNSNSFVGVGVLPNPTGDPALRPHVKLDVRGLVQLGADGGDATCNKDPALTGALRWFHTNDSANKYYPWNDSLQVCNGTSWMQVSLNAMVASGGQCNPTTDSPFLREYDQCSCPGRKGTLIWQGTQTCTCNGSGTQGSWSCTTDCGTPPPGAGCN